MKPHLPKKLLVAVLAACSMGINAKAETESSYTLGQVMYVGDSITHGVETSSYRWALHKILVDNGVTYDEVGYQTGHHNGWGSSNNYTYSGVTFENRHSAQASQRTYNTAGRTDTSRLGHSSIQNWLGVSTVDSVDPSKKMDKTAYTGSVSQPDTFMLMLGTNDLLSDYTDTLANGSNLETVTTALLGAADSAGRRTGGDMGTIVDTMYASNADATVYVTTIPCWANHSNNKGENTHVAVQTYNESLKKWVSDYNAKNGTDMVLVDVNRGLLDVAATTSFYGVSSMFNNADGGSDGLHPNSQGDLIIAGNMARAMGIAGRTAGLERVAATDFQTTVAADSLVLKGETSSLSFSWEGDVTPTGGYTAELMGFTLGNGSANGWDTTNNFSITVGNGSMSGTLDINEAYIQWNGSVAFSTGSSVLFSEDMSSLTENIRIAYHTGDSTNNIAEGYYIWLGDMLIGEALQGTASTVNGVTLSYSGSSSYTLSALAMDATAAYAPTVGVYNISTDGKVVIPNNVTTTKLNTTAANVYASNTTNVRGDVWVEVTGGQAKGWAAAQGNTGGVDGDVTMIFTGEFLGSFDGDKSATAAGSVFGAVNSAAGVTGNVTVQFDAANALYNSFTNKNAASVVGSYESNIGGTFKAVINAGTFAFDILGGLHTGTNKSIGATQIFVNGGEVKGSVYGGGVAGSILGDAEVTINGGKIVGSVYGGGKGDTIYGDTLVSINGGEIGGSVYAGGTVGTIKGDATLVIDGALTSITGNVGVSTGSTIEGNALVAIKNITDNELARSSTLYSGEITGGSKVAGTSTLQLDNASFAGYATVSAFNSVNLVNGSVVSVASVSLDDAATSVISLADNSELTVSNSLSTAADLAVTGGAGKLVLNGADNTVAGQLSIDAGNELVLNNGSVLNVSNIIVNDGTLTLNGTVNWDITSVDGLEVQYDTEMLNGTTNGLGSGIISGLITGTGTLTNTDVINGTYNGGSISLDTATGVAKVENTVFYVVAPQETDSSYQYITTATGHVKMFSTVDVGVHSHTVDGPFATEGANDALQFYVGENGVLCISGDSNTMTAGEILQTAQGDGSIILRAPGRTEPSTGDTKADAIRFKVDQVAQFEGDIYMGPVMYDGSSSIIGQAPVYIELEDGADISSFNSLNAGSSEMSILVNGVIGRSSEEVGHINNLSTLGSSVTRLYIGANANDTIVLGGDTGISSFDYDGAGSATGATGSTLVVNAYRDLHLIVENLTDGAAGNQYARTYAMFNNGYIDDTSAVGHQTVIDINSFDFSGVFYVQEFLNGGNIHANVTLLDGQTMRQDQYVAWQDTEEMNTPSVTIKGTGTYILNDGASIFDNVGRLSTETIDGERVWAGTVVVSNLVATNGWNSGVTGKNGINFEDYGNEQSTVHFKGFKGHVFNSVTDSAYLNIDIAQDLILENSTSATTPHAFEVSDGYSDQKLNFLGDISGTGDFVVSAGATEKIFFKGDVSEWKDGAEFKVTNGNQHVTFQDNATEINADLVTTNGTMNATISNAEAVTVNGKVNREGGTLNLTVDTAKGTAFTNDVNVSKLTVAEGSVASFAKGATAGNVSIGVRGNGTAEVSDGMTVAGNSISGGEAKSVNFSFTSNNNNSVSNVSLKNVGISSVADSVVNLDAVTAENVYLHGQQVTFSSVDVVNTFTLDSVTEGFNEVRFESNAFAGMTLAADGENSLTLAVNNAVNWNDTSNINPNNVTIVLKGFTMEGVGRGEGWLSNLTIVGNGDATASTTQYDGQFTVGTGINVNELLVVDQYKYVTYEQRANGLYIRMSNIPEPTTSTLSLLALAAIAARRRRK